MEKRKSRTNNCWVSSVPRWRLPGVAGRKPQDYSASQVGKFQYQREMRSIYMSKEEVTLTFHFNSQTPCQVLKNEFWDAFKPGSHSICSWKGSAEPKALTVAGLFPRRLFPRLPSPLRLPSCRHRCRDAHHRRARSIFFQCWQSL